MMPKKKYKVTYGVDSVILADPTDIVEANTKQDAESIARKTTYDSEFIEEQIKPIVSIKVKKVEEVI